MYEELNENPAESAATAVDAATIKATAAAAKAAEKSKDHFDLSGTRFIPLTGDDIRNGQTDAGNLVLTFVRKHKKAVQKTTGRGSKKVPAFNADGTAQMVTKLVDQPFHLVVTPDEFSAFSGEENVTRVIFGGPAEAVMRQLDAQGVDAPAQAGIDFAPIFNWFKTTEYREVLAGLYLKWAADVSVSEATAAAVAQCVIPEGVEQAEIARRVSVGLAFFTKKVEGSDAFTKNDKEAVAKLSHAITELAASGALPKGRKPTVDDWAGFKKKLSRFLNQTVAGLERLQDKVAAGDTTEDQVDKVKHLIGALNHADCLVGNQIDTLRAAAEAKAKREAKKLEKQKAAMAADLESSLDSLDFDL